MPEQNIKELLKQEYARCAKDPVYFMRKYVKIQHPLHGTISFLTYPFQNDVLGQLAKHKKNIILKSRQLGITTLVAAYSLWLMTFHTDKEILCLSITQETSKASVTKVRFANDNLPNWLKVPAIEDNRLSLKLKNGSRIVAASSAGTSGRSSALSLLIVDEAAFIDGIESIWLSAQPTISTGGNVIILSTPNGVGNFFHKMWTESEQGLNDLNRIKLPWHLHPDRNQEWREEQTRLSGPKGAAQECFEGNTRIYTRDGFKKIKDIELGDLVLTHTGKFSKVTKKYKKTSSDLISIYSSTNRTPRLVTKNHPFLSRTKSWVEIGNVINGTTLCSFPREIDTSHLSRKSEVIDLYKIIRPDYFELMLCNQDMSIYINDRKHKTVHNRFVSVDEDFGFLLGIYMSEGWCESNRVYFCFNWEMEKLDWPARLENIITKKFGLSSFQYRKCGNNSGQFTVCSQVLSKTLKYFTNGSDGYNKSLSKNSFTLFNLDAWRGFCDGSFVGDGMVLKKYAKTFTSRSEEFALNVKYGLHLLGHNLVSYTTGKTDHESCYIVKILGSNDLICENRMISNMVIPSEYKTKNIQGLDEDFQYSTLYVNQPCVSVAEVYNLEVEGEHTYVTEHFVVHNCDCEFSTSGNTVIEISVLEWYEKEQVREPLEKRGVDRGYWIFDYPQPGKSYMISADVGRGDSEDFSAAHVVDIEKLEQVAEYKGKLPTKEFAHALMTMATEYNMGLLVVENANIGWAVIQEILDKSYPNLFYSSADLQYVDVEQQMTNKINTTERKMTPGFSTTNKTRPLVISKLESYFRNKEVIVHSARLIEELKVFIWKQGGTTLKAEAMEGYHDDLVISFGIAMWIRDVALRLRTEADSITKIVLSKIGSSSNDKIKNKMAPLLVPGANNPYGIYNDPWKMKMGQRGEEDLRWLIGVPKSR